jgi:hypothetical protein
LPNITKIVRPDAGESDIIPLSRSSRGRAVQGPTPEELAQYRKLSDKVRDASRAGTPDSASEKELEEFVKRTGIANEAPPDFFDPDELDREGESPKNDTGGES